MFLPLHRRRSTRAFRKKAGGDRKAFSLQSRSCFLKETDILHRADKCSVSGFGLSSDRMGGSGQNSAPVPGGVYNSSLDTTLNVNPAFPGIDRQSRPGLSSVRSAKSLPSNRVCFSLRSFPPCRRNAGREEFGINHYGLTAGEPAALQRDEPSRRAGIYFRGLSRTAGSTGRESFLNRINYRSFVYVIRSTPGTFQRSRTITVMNHACPTRTNGNREMEYALLSFNSKTWRRYA